MSGAICPGVLTHIERWCGSAPDWEVMIEYVTGCAALAGKARQSLALPDQGFVPRDEPVSNWRR
jgi:hypothetical protein